LRIEEEGDVLASKTLSCSLPPQHRIIVPRLALRNDKRARNVALKLAASL
jgi:hypothetical protein